MNTRKIFAIAVLIIIIVSVSILLKNARFASKTEYVEGPYYFEETFDNAEVWALATSGFSYNEWGPDGPQEQSYTSQTSQPYYVDTEYIYNDMPSDPAWSNDAFYRVVDNFSDVSWDLFNADQYLDHGVYGVIWRRNLSYTVVEDNPDWAFSIIGTSKSFYAKERTGNLVLKMNVSLGLLFPYSYGLDVIPDFNGLFIVFDVVNWVTNADEWCYIIGVSDGIKQDYAEQVGTYFELIPYQAKKHMIVVDVVCPSDFDIVNILYTHNFVFNITVPKGYEIYIHIVWIMGVRAGTEHVIGNNNHRAGEFYIDYINIEYYKVRNPVNINTPVYNSTIDTSIVNISWSYDISYTLDYFLVYVNGTQVANTTATYVLVSLVDGVYSVIVEMHSGSNAYYDTTIFRVDTVSVNKTPDNISPFEYFNLTIRFGSAMLSEYFDIKVYIPGHEPQTETDLNPQYSYWFRYHPDVKTIDILGAGDCLFLNRNYDNTNKIYYDTLSIKLSNISWADTWTMKVVPSVGFEKTTSITVKELFFVSTDKTGIYYSIVPDVNNTIVLIGSFTINATGNAPYSIYIRASGNATGENTEYEIPIWNFYFDLDGTWQGNENELSINDKLVKSVPAPPYYNVTVTVYIYWRVITPLPKDTYTFTIIISVYSG